MRNTQDQEKEKVVIPFTPPPSAYTQTIRITKEYKVR